MFKFSLLDEKWSFLGMFSPKNYNWLFKTKFGTLINLNMLNLSWSRLFYFRPEILFLWANLVKKFEIVCLRLNFVPRLRTLIMMFISFVLDQKYSFWEYWSQIFPKVVIRFGLSYLIWLRPVFGFCFKKLVKVPENASALQSVSVTKNYWITT